MAFQIQDDILDFIGDEDTTGKEINQDLASGIYTLPVICLLKDERYSSRTRNILGKKDISRQDIAVLKEMFKESNYWKLAEHM